nr:carbohydrate porin [uncultured Vibrio sp.]
MKNVLNITTASLLVLSSMNSFADVKVIDNEKGNFSIGGNVEINVNFQDRESNENNDTEFNQDGRVLIEFSGEKYTNKNYYVGVKAQPLFESTGNIALDDAYFEFGKKDIWSIKAGRFETYDMFPVGLDVFLDYSGDTANDLYTDGAAYLYQMKEARGRGSDGQIMYNHKLGNIYVEIGAMLGDRSNLFDGGVGGYYHGQQIDSAKDTILLRPVLAYQMGDFRLAASFEKNLVSNSIMANGIDISDRTGFGLTGNWTSGDWVVNTNIAYLDAVDENNLSLGANVLWNDLGLGYVYTTNQYENKDFSAWATGDVNVSTVYASYAIRNVLEVTDFSILTGTYYSMVDNKLSQQASTSSFSETDDFGVRVRLFYAF